MAAIREDRDGDRASSLCLPIRLNDVRGRGSTAGARKNNGNVPKLTGKKKGQKKIVPRF